ncbi:P2X purinoceptor 4b [Sardina pilchardus]|uniref:P2X purinoceptor 4b n=1 Tax=Sardina pilchardus TaxID=27697 RepID=UPI002E141A8F
MAASCWSRFLHCFFDYETPRTIIIYNKGIGSVFRFVQFLIIAYVVGYVCVVQKGYQETEAVISSVTTKVKGFTATNTSALGLHVWDVTEFVIPPQGDDSFFVLTNVIATPGQIQQACPELPYPSSVCESDDNCSEGHSDVQGNGVQTGLCVNYSASVKTCQVLAWCPHENDSSLPKPALLVKAENFTVMIKNSVRYPKFGFIKKNILPNFSKEYLKTCRYHSSTDPHCPIFRLGEMVQDAGEDFLTMAEQGGVMGILIDWTCDLDWPEDYCLPKYSFVRMDKATHNTAPGFNFRFAKYSNNGSTQSRTLIKGFGVRFDVIVFGTAGKFSIVLTVVNLGAALSFLSLVGAVCDWVLVTCTAKREFYAKHKTTELPEDGTGEVISIGKIYGTS